MNEEGNTELREQARKPHIARRQYWVLPKLQGRFIGWFVAVSAVLATTATLGILLVLWYSLANEFAAGGESLERGTLFWHACARVFATAGALIVIFGVVAYLAGLLVSHRVAGPLYRLGQIAQQVTRGRHARKVELRQRDYIHEFADHFNTLLAYFQQRVRNYQEVLTGLDERLAGVEDAVADGKIDVSDIQKELQETLQAIREARLDKPSEDPPST